MGKRYRRRKSKGRSSAHMKWVRSHIGKRRGGRRRRTGRRGIAKALRLI